MFTSGELLLGYNSVKPHQLFQFNMTTSHCCLLSSWLITLSEQIHTALGSADKIKMMGIILPFKQQTSVGMIENKCSNATPVKGRYEI